MSECKWEVGRTYKTTLPGVTGSIRRVDSVGDFFGEVNGSHCDMTTYWHRDGRDYNENRRANLTTELADEPQVEPVKPQPVDVINAPPHYNQGDIECIDAIQAALSPEEFRGHLRACALKYLWRCNHKGGREDLLKAEWYLKRLNREMIRGECASHGIKGCEKEGGEA